ncbi:putative alpha-isopropylmalate/homocitrate synthase family transferase [cyanobacterium endosymbiont of Rhopalodia gibberula]|uniref:citramalate synthase n=1 Tax=cyanobacterium endosymbiont of Rhopalodia gibberula TaxID=1763363 RepID=UPI000DC6D264|nr:citramalate synthase [cyanobacterium endosymbiont of Rhopalodia gibberula]BBA79778.1 putative alpha-isopropylmalate/homocitrate synthase family transferase [cyanobacterium endosymbiont of Rhopalodia gibberula]
MGIANQVLLYDTTLRDGAQREGISLSLEDKLKIAHQLDKLGIPFIEGGWPGANPKDAQFFWKLREEPLTQAEVVAFCSTRRPYISSDRDRMLQMILAAGTRWVTIFGKSWDLHVIEGLKTTLEENLAMIRDTIEYLCSQGRKVIYDAEHWFDGYKQNPDYALQTLKAAKNAGAIWLVLCDTNGGTLPQEVSQIVKEVVEELDVGPDKETFPKLGIHTHNDSGTAVANGLAGVVEGVRMIHGTINGYGERCGNANLCTLIPNLQFKMGYSCLRDTQLTQLSQTSRLISEIVNLAPDDHAPFVGRSAFAHKGGVHVSAVQKNPLTYEHIKPEKIGNKRRIVISEQSGLSNVLLKAKTFGIELKKEDIACRDILERIKKLEHEGYQFEAAESSFELLMRQALGQRKTMFQLKGFQVHCDMLQEQEISYSNALATIKVTVNGEDRLEVAEGNGPVAALDSALRKALENFYPEVAEFHLTDYKVRILDGESGTSSKTRVLVESSNGKERWTTVGVSPNILEASYEAVVEGIEYGLFLKNSMGDTVTI